MNIGTIFQILQYAIPTIKTVEGLFRGSGRGEQKKEAVTNGILTHLDDLVHASDDLPEVKRLKWQDVITNSPELIGLLGNLIDAVVSLINFFAKLEGDDETPEKES